MQETNKLPINHLHYKPQPVTTQIHSFPALTSATYHQHPSPTFLYYLISGHPVYQCEYTRFYFTAYYAGGPYSPIDTPLYFTQSVPHWNQQLSFVDRNFQYPTLAALTTVLPQNIFWLPEQNQPSELSRAPKSENIKSPTNPPPAHPNSLFTGVGDNPPTQMTGLPNIPTKYRKTPFKSPNKIEKGKKKIRTIFYTNY